MLNCENTQREKQTLDLRVGRCVKLIHMVKKSYSKKLGGQRRTDARVVQQMDGSKNFKFLLQKQAETLIRDDNDDEKSDCSIFLVSLFVCLEATTNNRSEACEMWADR